MTVVTSINNTQVRKLHTRLRALEALRRRVDAEIRGIQHSLDGFARQRRPKTIAPECGTESAYQWHRYHQRDNWPLPADDPCGCRAAHRDHTRTREQDRRLLDRVERLVS